MTNAIERAALKRLTEKHVKTFNAPLGKRKCTYELVPECLGTADEALFKGRMCKRCIKTKLRLLYDIRVANRGYPRQKPGPKPKVVSGSEDEEVVAVKSIKKVRQGV